MSIQTTQTITQEIAVSRINRIKSLVIEQDYKGIENTTFESDYSISKFVGKGVVLTDLSKCTNSMLEEQMDQPFYRFSMFDNYQIGEIDI